MPLISTLYILFFLSSLLVAEEKKFSDELQGLKSPYTDPLRETALKNWPPSHIPYATLPKESLYLGCIETPSQKFLIGVEMAMQIQAPIERVHEVYTAFDEYIQYFPGYEEIRTISSEGNVVETFWEQIVPVFFVKNLKFNLQHIADRSNKDRYVYRSQLKSSKDLGAVDIFTVLERKGKETLYTEFDFADANLGILKTLAPRRIWEDSLEMFYQSTLGIRLKSENPNWENAKVKEEAKNRMPEGFGEATAKNCKPFYLHPSL